MSNGVPQVSEAMLIYLHYFFFLFLRLHNFKELKESMKMMSHQIENFNKEIIKIQLDINSGAEKYN